MLSRRVQRVKPSPTLAVDAKAKAMKAEGHDVINFGVGEPDFDTPQNIKDAAIRAIKDGKTKYTAAGGIDPLKDAIIAKFRADNALEYERSEIIVSCGAKHSLYNIAQALLDPGDEVIIPAPYWVSYPDQTLLNDATPVIVETREDEAFRISPRALEAAITPRTKAIVLNYPSNPTGQAYSRQDLEAIAEVCLRHDLHIVSDEIYEKLLYDGAAHASIASLGPEIKARTIVVNGVSKAYAMTGWRIGYAAGPQRIVSAMGKVQGQSTSNPTSISQWATVEALAGPQGFIATMLAEFDKRRVRLVSGLNAIAGIKCPMPTGAFYAFPNVSALYERGARVRNSEQMAMYLLEEARVALVHGSAFGSDAHIRISYATSMRDIEEALKRIEAAVAKL